MSTTDTEAAGGWKAAENYLTKRAEEAQAPTNADGVIDPTKAQVGFDPTPAPKLADKLLAIDGPTEAPASATPPATPADSPFAGLLHPGDMLAAIANAPRSYPTTEPDTAPIPRTLWSGLDRVHDYSDEMDIALDRVRAQIEQFKVLKELLHQELTPS
jgi:hypothetical protein